MLRALIAIVVNAAGAWADEIAALAGAASPAPSASAAVSRQNVCMKDIDSVAVEVRQEYAAECRSTT